MICYVIIDFSNCYFSLTDMSPFENDPPQVLRVKAGHAAVFHLPLIASVPEPSVTWQREDNHKPLYGTKYAVTDEQSQIILSVDSQEMARYRYSFPLKLFKSDKSMRYYKDSVPILNNNYAKIDINLASLRFCPIEKTTSTFRDVVKI